MANARRMSSTVAFGHGADELAVVGIADVDGPRAADLVAGDAHLGVEHGAVPDVLQLGHHVHRVASRHCR